VHLDFIAISRYAPDSGRVRITQDLEHDVTGRDVVLVEDLVDTGLTLAYLVRLLEERGARRVRICALLDRPARRIVPLDVHYRGLEIPDVYVVGYGLHHADLYRNLPDVYEADRAAIGDDPAAYVADLYGRAPA
jgi:hypoxanthine phosphoribosyltransferase